MVKKKAKKTTKKSNTKPKTQSVKDTGLTKRKKSSVPNITVKRESKRLELIRILSRIDLLLIKHIISKLAELKPKVTTFKVLTFVNFLILLGEYVIKYCAAFYSAFKILIPKSYKKIAGFFSTNLAIFSVQIKVLLSNTLVAILRIYQILLSKLISIKSSFIKTLLSYKSKIIKTKYNKVLAAKIELPEISLPSIKFRFPRILKRFISLKPFVAFLFGIFVGLFFIALPIQLNSFFKQLPSPDLLSQSPQKTTKILDRKGRLLYEIYVDKKYEPVTLDRIPNHVVQATLAVEDSEFYNHRGIRVDSIIRALKAIIIDEELQGGSTITQQLIKNVLLTPDRTLNRKVKEGILALMVENKYTKNQILELYFNNIPYGGTAWGIQSASHKYFGKDVDELNLAEAALLAGLPSSPSVYSPLTGNSDLAKQRQRYVLDRMVYLGYIDSATAKDAFDQELNYVPQAEYIRAPHFVAFVREELVNKYGERFVDFGGLTVVTTLDLDLQDDVQEIVKNEVDASATLNITNGAAVVLDARTSEILAYVGSRDYFADGDGAYDVLRAFRQPGSSIKPLTYVLALEKGATPATLIEDRPLTIQSGGQTYSPVNYDGRYHGVVTLRQALANSYNIPAVKMVRIVGPDNLVSLGKDLGLQNWEVGNTYGLSVTLGGKEVRLLDLANAYATFARQGTYRDSTTLISVKDSNGFDLYEDARIEKRVLSEGSTYIIGNILSDNRARTPAFGSNSSLVITNHTVAVKTGTTDQNRDNLTVGYTPSYVVGVWVGNNDNEPMNRRLVSGLSGAAPIWNKIMSTVLNNKSDEPFPRPNSVFVKTDPACNISEVFVRDTAPKTLCPDKKQEKASSE